MADVWTLEPGVGGPGSLDGAALLDGRSGGQTLCGGTGSSQKLILKGTSAAGGGQVEVPVPLIAQVSLVAGDLDLKAPCAEGETPSAWWRLIEAPHGIRALNVLTGDELEFCLRPARVGPLRRGLRWLVRQLPAWI